MKFEMLEQGNPLCPRCKFGRLEPQFSNVVKRIEYPLGKWKCVNCQALYEAVKPSQKTGKLEDKL